MARTKAQLADYQRAWIAKNVERKCYHNLKNNAKHRGIPFELTFEQFLLFAIRTEYINKRGKTIYSLTIDRMRGSVGYVLGNIRVITLGKNIRIQRKLEFHLRETNREVNRFRYTMPNFGELKVVGL
jgi:hypothetical protein